MRTKLPQITPIVSNPRVEKRDFETKQKMKKYAESRRNIKSLNLQVGDKALMRNVTERGKLVPKFQPTPFVVQEKKGSMIVARRGDEVKARNSSHFRKIQCEDLEEIESEIESEDTIEQPETFPEQPKIFPEMSDEFNLEIPTPPENITHPDIISEVPTGMIRNDHSTDSSQTLSRKTPRRSSRNVKLSKKYDDFQVDMPKLKR
jgi:hypothetical protein